MSETSLPEISPETHAAIARHNAAAMDAIMGVMHEPPAEPEPKTTLPFVYVMQKVTTDDEPERWQRVYVFESSRGEGHREAEDRMARMVSAGIPASLLRVEEGYSR